MNRAYAADPRVLIVVEIVSCRQSRKQAPQLTALSTERRNEDARRKP